MPVAAGCRGGVAQGRGAGVALAQRIAKNAGDFLKSCAMKAFDALDKLDRAILRRLQDNGRETYDVIGEQLGISRNTIYMHLRNHRKRTENN